MAPSPQIVSRDDSSGSTPVTPLVIAGIAFAGTILFGVGLWLVIHTYKKRNRSGDVAVGGATSSNDHSEKAFTRPRQVPFLPLLSLSIGYR